MPLHGSEGLADRLRPFATCFTAAVWRHVPVLVAGALLAPGRRTVTAALRVTGLERSAGFAVHHRVLSAARWSARAVAHRLLLVLVATLGPRRPGGDRHRRHHRATLGGQDRGARHLSRSGALLTRPLRQGQRPALAVADGDGAGSLGRRWALPFLTVLAPSERGAQARETPQEADRLGPAGAVQTARWLPGRRMVAVADSSFSALDLCAWSAAAVHDHPPAPRCRPLRAGPRAQARHQGAPGGEGAAAASLAERIRTGTPWRRVTIAGWYGGGRAGWTSLPAPRSGTTPACGCRSAGCWCATRAASGSRRPSSAPISRPSRSLLGWFVRRWRARPHSRRRAVTSASRPSGSGRTWPSCAPRPRCSACSRWWRSGPPIRARRGPPLGAAYWYRKRAPTFSDALAPSGRSSGARRFPHLTVRPGGGENPPGLIERFLLVACRPP